MTGAVEIDGVTFQVNFKPNMAALVSELPKKISEDPSSSTTSSDDFDAVVGDFKKTKTKKNRFGLSLPSKLKKKLKSRTNKKKKGKSKMASLLAAMEPSKALMQKWKASGGSYQDLEESSGSLFAGRLEEDMKEITNLPTIQESCELKQEPPSPQKNVTQNVVEERTSSKKQLKQRLKRFLKTLKKLKKSKKSRSQSSVADTASTTSSPTRIHNMMMVDDSSSSCDDDAMRDDTEVALASVDETFFSLPSEPSLPSTTTTISSDVVLPPSLTLVRPTPSSVARQASCAANNNIVWNNNDVCDVPREDDDAYPSDEEDSSVDNSSVDSIVSPVPSCPPAQLKGSPPRKKILNYKKPKAIKKNKTVKKAPVVVLKPTVVASLPRQSRNVWALVLAAATLCALSTVWQKCFNLPQEEVCKITDTTTTAALVKNTGANISFVLPQGESYKMEEIINQEDSEWPFDECLLSETPVSSSFFDENGVLDCSYPIIYV